MRKPESRMKGIVTLDISTYFIKDPWIPRVKLSSRKSGAFISM